MGAVQVTAVTGTAGVGKTRWIREYLSQMAELPIYWAAGAGSLALDAVHLRSEFPELEVLLDSQVEAILGALAQGIPLVVEVGFHRDPVEMQQVVGAFECTWVGLTADGDRDPQSYLWADVLVEGQPVPDPDPATEIWRADLSGQVWDPASLEAFWDELLLGAYGAVRRVKGIFEMPEGQALWGEFTGGSLGVTLDDFDVLPFPRHLQGRPQRLSGLEIVGEQLDRGSLRQGVEDCCLRDAILEDYQRQVREAIAQGELEP